jgi:hypothetical protein
MIQPLLHVCVWRVRHCLLGSASRKPLLEVQVGIAVDGAVRTLLFFLSGGMPCASHWVTFLVINTLLCVLQPSAVC